MWMLHASELCDTMRLEGIYIIEKQWKPYTSKNLTLGGETPECGPHWVTWYINFRGRNFGILPLFHAHDTSLEISLQGLHP